jgi:hypothetical protein
VILHQYPCLALGFGFRQEKGKPFKEIFTIVIITENLASLYSSDHDMMQEAVIVKAGDSGHEVASTDHKYVPPLQIRLIAPKKITR